MPCELAQRLSLRRELKTRFRPRKWWRHYETRGYLERSPGRSLGPLRVHTAAVCDAGLPIPLRPEVVDLTFRLGVPNFETILLGLLEELVIEGAGAAEEVKSSNRVLLEETPCLTDLRDPFWGGSFLPMGAYRQKMFEPGSRQAPLWWEPVRTCAYGFRKRTGARWGIECAEQLGDAVWVGGRPETRTGKRKGPPRWAERRTTIRRGVQRNKRRL